MPKSFTLPSYNSGTGSTGKNPSDDSAAPMPREHVIRNLMQYSQALWSAKSSKGHIHLLMN